MILLSEILSSESPEHRVEQVILISEYKCGCQTAITFAGRPHQSKGGISVGNGGLWSDSSACSKKHTISFKEIDHCENISPKNVVTEILGFNSISVSSRIKNFKKVA